MSMWRTTLLALCLGAAARAEVLVLDAAGGGDFTTVQQVVNGAAAGDIVIVRPGDYASETGAATFGKPLSIVADGTGIVEFPGISITAISPGQTFVLRGVRMDDPAVISQLFVYGCDGAVIVEDCTIVGTPESPWAQTAAVKANSTNLTLESCTILGGDGAPFLPQQAGLGGAGLYALDARISVNHCTVHGGQGGGEYGSSPLVGAKTGGAGVLVTATELFLAGCEVTGGAGGTDTGPPLAGGGAPGATGVQADATSVVH